ncbi:hypothetical protein BGZ63DRAFT_11970 [Mariannaea sp. PMI_226]|nr:hypothetical protein BGZ63DRAFT_11970 [Mariannaea sp. PMI_226]
MASARVLRLTRSDDTSEFVLLQVTHKGSRPLDLKLVGTEGEAPYVTSLKHDRVSSLRVKNCPASESEWQAILEAVFKQSPLSHIQATATVQSGSSISITIRKEIQGITQRLGDITLNYDSNEAIELFEWCGMAAEASAEGKQAIADLTAKSRGTEATVADLQSQLEELLRVKDEDETAMLQKFRDLLNEKKVKIREQQQVLASTSFNASHPGSQPSQPAPSRSSESAKPSRKAGQSRASKRKQPASRSVEDLGGEGVAEAMDVDIKQEPEDSDLGNSTEAAASTETDSDDGNDDDDDDDGDDNNETAVKAPPPKAAKTEEGKGQPPPRRDLPFNNKPVKKASASKAPAESETDSDDEL